VRGWTCQRVSDGVRCGWKNPTKYQVCRSCGKRKPPRRRPAHLKALELPYEEYVALSGGVEACGICGAPPKSKRLNRDHCHRTGEPRGVLCPICNKKLADLSAEWLGAALAYVERDRMAA
jgi:RNA polymerase subunit RPABC4/transcription elongation factor Spt4